ncbi:tetratricopeptide repeat protein [Verrucomicrobiaceae bacterium R5-34]|uniref:Tetratricopeptide repeat protein n=1 Tax=Oceaniferula flava TaxID=2800421 RepID=A0AAE2SG44_9BACT|nr:tetratricopeptide repeat protein [Oceaniferula flavus]MBK1830894.1 tetratricopeptide repeat protein [Verrucomicrobiaceae bacterium R5-34]MBK1855741.1 tetratricopeptide repeat protein [Oceaniferula flavus]MBM1137048.1 tetratricopeptide repeat protein [Oceaniferula flavus]
MRKKAAFSPVICRISLSLGLMSSLAVITSCGPDASDIPLVNAAGGSAVGANSSAADTLLAQGQAYQAAGNNKKAISTYKELAKKYPYSKAAGEASFAEGQILDKEGDLFKAFEAYQRLITNHQASPHYSAAIKRQEAVAHAAANGVIKNNFLGMKTRISPDKVEKMLGQVRDNAPKAASASKAQYTIGQVWQKEGSADRAMAAYKRVDIDFASSPYAPDALYQTGEILVIKAERGNQNKANVNRARQIYNDLVQRYPSHPRAADARKRLSMLGGQDIQRSYDVAEFYRAKGQNQSALFYYREVMNMTKSGALYNQAKQRVAELSGQ